MPNVGIAPAMAVAFSFGKQGGFMNNFFATPEGAWGDGSVHPVSYTHLTLPTTSRV